MRISWLDILKCFAIYSVVAGHMMSCGAFESQIGLDVYQEFILVFHMPLFTILSGWFFSAKRSAWDFLKEKGIGILLPYIVWGFVWFFVRPFISLALSGQEVHLSSIIWHVKFYLNDGLLHYGWWFLRGLFLTLLLSYGSVKIAEHCGKTIASHAYLWGGLLSTIVLYGFTFAGVIPNQPVKDSILKGFIYMYPFFWAGYGLKQMYRRFADAMRDLKCIASVWLLFFIALFFWNGGTDTFYAMNTSVFATEGANDIVGVMVVYKTMFRFAVGVVGSLAFILSFERLFGKESHNRIRLFSQNIGKETLGIYILQSLVFWSLPNRDILGLGEIGNFCFALFISFAIVIAAYSIIRVSSKNRRLGLFLWGKRYEVKA